MKISNITNDKEYKSLRPFPNYSYESFPYVMIKDTKSLNVVNVRTLQSRVIVKNSPYGWDVHRTCLMDFQTNPGSDLLTIFNLELVSKPISGNTRIRDHISSIKKYTINTGHLESCFL
jgi:hypothetical protein